MTLWYRLTGGCSLFHRGPILLDLGSVDPHEFSRAKMLKRAIERAEADCASCVVSHAKVLFISAADRARARYQQAETIRRFPSSARQR